MHTPPFSLPGNCFKESECLASRHLSFGNEKREKEFSHSYILARKIIVYNYNCAHKNNLAESIYHMNAAKEMYFGFLNTCFFSLMHLYFLLGMHE